MINNKYIFLIIENKYNNVIKDLLEKMFLCKVYCLSYVDELCYDNLPYYYNQRLSMYKKGLDEGCNIILSYFDNDILNVLKKDYDFIEYKLSNNFIKKYKIAKNINNKINLFVFLKYNFLIKLVKYMIDNIQKYITSNIGYEINKGSFSRIETKINKDLVSHLKIFSIFKKYFYYKKRLKQISLDKPKKCLNVGIFSNEYIPNKLYCNYTIERILSNKNMIGHRNNNLNKLKTKYYLSKIKKYCKYDINDNIINNIYKITRSKYDGIIYITQDGNILDDASLIMIYNICNKEKISIINLKFDNKINSLNIENNIKMLWDLININNTNKISKNL